MLNLEQRAIGRLRWLARRIQHKLDDALVFLTAQSHPGWLTRAGIKLVYWVRLALLIPLESGQGQARLWQGAEMASGELLRVIYIGDQQAYKVHSPQYLQQILFQPGSLRVDEELGTFPAVRARSRAQALASQADLLIVEGNSLLRWTPPSGDWQLVPTWVRMVMTFCPGQSWEQVEKGMRSHKNNIKLMLKKGFKFCISHREADFERFYDRMHVPMMEERHAGYGVIDLKESMRSYFHQGFLLLVCPPGQDGGGEDSIAGALVHLKGRSAFGIANGVLDGDTRWYDQGVVSAVYYESIRWCFENGITRYDAGGVRPFQNDGLFFYKSRWGLRPELDLWLGRHWLFWAPARGPQHLSAQVAYGWLKTHPALQVEGVQFSPRLDGASSYLDGKAQPDRPV